MRKEERDQDDAGIKLVRSLASNPDFLLYLMSSTTQMTVGPGNHGRDHNATFEIAADNANAKSTSYVYRYQEES